MQLNVKLVVQEIIHQGHALLVMPDFFYYKVIVYKTVDLLLYNVLTILTKINVLPLVHIVIKIIFSI